MAWDYRPLKRLVGRRIRGAAIKLLRTPGATDRGGYRLFENRLLLLLDDGTSIEFGTMGEELHTAWWKTPDMLHQLRAGHNRWYRPVVEAVHDPTRPAGNTTRFAVFSGADEPPPQPNPAINPHGDRLPAVTDRTINAVGLLGAREAYSGAATRLWLRFDEHPDRWFECRSDGEIVPLFHSDRLQVLDLIHRGKTAYHNQQLAMSDPDGRYRTNYGPTP